MIKVKNIIVNFLESLMHIQREVPLLKRLFFIILSFMIVFGSINIDAYAVLDSTDYHSIPIKVKLNDKLLKFDVQPIIKDGRTMVPMRAIFEYLGASVSWYEKTRNVVAYKDNMFIKLKIDSKTAYKNGKSFNLDAAPMIKNGRTLVPVRFVSESLGMNVNWDSETRTVVLNYEEGVEILKEIDDITYKLVSLNDYGLKFMIPYYWNQSDNEGHVFTHEDEENKIKMTIDIKQFEKPKSLDKFTEENKLNLLEKYKNNIVIVGNDTKEINNIKVNVVQLRNSSSEPEVKQVLYFFTTSNYGYIITFSYYSEGNDSQLQNMFSAIIDTIEIGSLTVDVQDEHYIEYDEFFKKGFKLDSEIYSNMDVENRLKFKGTISKNVNLEYIFVKVAKGSESMEFKIPVKNHEFDSFIYTPFGLGKHNIIIGTPIDENNTSRYIMQFSVINTNNDYLRYLVPSRFIEKNDKEIASLANEITKNHITEYNKAVAMYKWVAENIDYVPNASIDNPRSAKQTLTDKKGDCDEIAFLYAALSRAIGIPAKVVSGKINEEYHAWNEIQINGKWIIVDATWGAGYIDSADGETFVKDLNMKYFNPDRTKYEAEFTDMEILPY